MHDSIVDIGAGNGYIDSMLNLSQMRSVRITVVVPGVYPGGGS